MGREPPKHWLQQWDIVALFLAALLFFTQVIYFFVSTSVIRVTVITVGLALVSCGVLNLIFKKRER